MRLSPRDLDRITLFNIAEMARRRRARGVKLNYPESVALISDEVLEEVRAGRSYAEVAQYGRQILTRDDVMDGVADMLTLIQVEGIFCDGTRVITIRNPIQAGAADGGGAQ